MFSLSEDARYYTNFNIRTSLLSKSLFNRYFLIFFLNYQIFRYQRNIYIDIVEMEKEISKQRTKKMWEGKAMYSCFHAVKILNSFLSCYYAPYLMKFNTPVKMLNDHK